MDLLTVEDAEIELFVCSDEPTERAASRYEDVPSHWSQFFGNLHVDM